MDGESPAVVKTAPCPKSPPKYPDFCGRRRLQLEVQILNREIGFLEEELQSLEGLEPVSRCCKAVEEFVGLNPDPLIPINKKKQQSCYFWKLLRSLFCFPISLLCCHCCCQKRNCCRGCPCPKDCSSSHCKLQCPHCAFQCPSPHCKCTECSPCSCLNPCCNITALCPSCPTCPTCRPCPPEASCCIMPQRTACAPSPCAPCRWRCCCAPFRYCCCCCPETSCPLPRPLCPDYSCGCIWSCPKCTEARLCRCCCTSKSSCITGCLC